MATLRAVIALANAADRSTMAEAIQQVDDAADVVSCENAWMVQQVLHRSEVDVAVLDADVLGTNGIDMVGSLEERGLVIAVLVVRDARDALRAYAAGFTDCMSKPLQPSRCEQALRRVRRRLAHREVLKLGERVHAALHDADDWGNATERHVRRLVIGSGARSHVISTASIEWVAAEDCYSRIHVGERSYVFRCTLAALERRLDPEQFIRPHRSSLVNVSYVREIRQSAGGGEVLVLASRAVVSISQRRRRDVLDRLASRLPTSA